MNIQLQQINYNIDTTVFVTGHRPNKLNGYKPEDNKKLLWKINSVVEECIKDGFTFFVAGGCIGIDNWFSQIVLKQREKHPHISLLIFVPCKNQSNRWNEKDKEIYDTILGKADAVIMVSEEEYKPYLMMERNKAMVNVSAKGICVWDGTKGGTGNCVKFAEKSNKQLIFINPNDYK